MNSLQFIPNYSHHLIGNGMQYVLLAEWYDYHRVKAPYLCSLVTTTIYQILNEAIENGAYKGTTVDPISDLLIFNPLGILLFSTNFAKKFFSETLSIHDWSLQPVLDPRNHFLENAGQQFVIKSKKVFANHYSVFFYWGIDGIVGISYNYKTMHNFSFGVGTVVNNLKEKRLKWSRVLTPEVDGAIGLFYDRNNSLMSSIIITCPRLYNARINIYPGLLGKKWFIPGFYVGFGEWDKFVFGLTSVYSPVGLAHRVK
ncbi:MAG: hypothetical protein ONB44_19080 [candidate division KSB1 bacterium]|nr:hypothetical protein [candidate division KSB1 bacterium]MDZ7311708.1 hypothetical protein [candidate division KSB1 bacterium]